MRLFAVVTDTHYHTDGVYQGIARRMAHTIAQVGWLLMADNEESLSKHYMTRRSARITITLLAVVIISAPA